MMMRPCARATRSMMDLNSCRKSSELNNSTTPTGENLISNLVPHLGIMFPISAMPGKEYPRSRSGSILAIQNTSCTNYIKVSSRTNPRNSCENCPEIHQHFNRLECSKLIMTIDASLNLSAINSSHNSSIHTSKPSLQTITSLYPSSLPSKV